MEETDIVVYRTKDYGMFSYIEENRGLIDNVELESVILLRDKLKNNPITVTVDFKVVDGQHRLAVAKKHGLWIYFVVDEEYEVEDIQALNVGARVWRLKDHLNFFCKQGLSEYIFMKEMLKKYGTTINLYGECFIVGYHSYVLKSGKMRERCSRQHIERVLSCFSDIEKLFKKFCGSKEIILRPFATSLMRLINHPEFDVEILSNGINRDPDKFLVCNKFSNSENSEKILLEIYNYKRRNKLEIKH